MQNMLAGWQWRNRHGERVHTGGISSPGEPDCRYGNRRSVIGAQGDGGGLTSDQHHQFTTLTRQHIGGRAIAEHGGIGVRSSRCHRRPTHHALGLRC